MSKPIGIRLKGDNWFNDGWISGILGLPKQEFYDADDPVTDEDCDAWLDGYAMGEETRGITIDQLREVIKKSIDARQLLVS